jgi:hypothetical protein
VPPPASDAELLARQSALQDEARELLAELDLAVLVPDAGPVLLAGSYVSGLMCWPEVDVMVLAGPAFSPQDAAGLLRRIAGLPGVTALDYRDERGARCVTGQARDERYHVAITVDRPARSWRIDLTLWLHDRTGTSRAGTRTCASASPPNSAARCCASRTCGTAGPSTRTRSAAWTSTPPCWTTGCAPRSSSRPGWPARDGPGS